MLCCSLSQSDHRDSAKRCLAGTTVLLRVASPLAGPPGSSPGQALLFPSASPGGCCFVRFCGLIKPACNRRNPKLPRSRAGGSPIAGQPTSPKLGPRLRGGGRLVAIEPTWLIAGAMLQSLQTRHLAGVFKAFCSKMPANRTLCQLASWSIDARQGQCIRLARIIF